MDVQADIGQIVNVLAGHQPDNLADFAFGIMARHAGKRVRIDLLVLCPWPTKGTAKGSTAGSFFNIPPSIRGYRFEKLFHVGC